MMSALDILSVVKVSNSEFLLSNIRHHRRPGPAAADLILLANNIPVAGKATAATNFI
jgi:hypothetical protein